MPEGVLDLLPEREPVEFPLETPQDLVRAFSRRRDLALGLATGTTTVIFICLARLKGQEDNADLYRFRVAIDHSMQRGQEGVFLQTNSVPIDTAREAMCEAAEKAIFEPTQRVHIERVFDASSQTLGAHRSPKVKEELGSFFLNVVKNYSQNPTMKGLYGEAPVCTPIKAVKGVKGVKKVSQPCSHLLIITVTNLSIV
jgi:hypothetical protein